ncbi:conserved Plasmodium protein, unknown function [Plasmodium relictum]|uniref:GYF domain-containing protein n=1 Tax=Plasmodium relictum TaxID=85471 RepID=A0A1J1HAF5_PLARL|nr:conserved Plasmodium protein, unknown function [Plasmodium relictum]CRH02370.1 conserved Plasmodium protein, unknown function [Plasmodium relictum]
MDINLYIHSIEIEFLNEKCYVYNNKEEHEENIVYSLNLKVEDSLHENNEKKNFQFFETPWYICFKNSHHELCMMSYEMNISHVFNLLENNERLILYLLRKNLKNEKIEYLHRMELNVKDEKFFDNTNSIIFENDKIKGKIKLYFKNGIIYNNLLNKIYPEEFLKKDIPCDIPIKSKEFVENKQKDETIDCISQNKCINNDFNELLNSRRTLYWIYLDDNNNEQGPFNSNTILNWIISEYFEDNTLIRLHDKKKFYKLYEVIEYIEKNVLLNAQSDRLYNQLSDKLENKFYDNISKTNEVQILDKLKDIDKKISNSEDIIKKEHINKENENECHLKNVDKKEYKNQYDMKQINKNENNEESILKNIICENLIDHIDKKNQENKNNNKNKKNITHHDNINNMHYSKLKIENDMYDKEQNENYWKINAKSYKNTKKKNEVKRLKKEIKKIKEEMIKLKEKNYKEKLLINDLSEDKLCYTSNKVKDNKEENIFLKENNDIIQNELHPSTINHIISNIRENNISNDNIHENSNINENNNNNNSNNYYNNNDYNNDYNNNDYNNNDYNHNASDTLEEREKTKNINNSNNINKSDMNKKINSSNNINEEFKTKEIEEKQKYIEIAMSSINQAQECLLNIKKKKITSYLNKIINLSNNDKLNYINNVKTDLSDFRCVDLKKNKEKNSPIQNSKYMNCYDSSKSFIFTNNAKKKCTLNESKKEKDKQMYIIPEEQVIKKLIIDMPLKNTKINYLLNIDNKKKLLNNFISQNNENKSRINKKKKEETTKLTFNILNNSSKVIYDYNINYDQFLKYVIFIQYNVKKWIKKKRINDNLFFYDHYYDIFNLKKLNNLNIKKPNDIYNDYITQIDQKEKIKEALNLKNLQNLRKYSLNYKNDYIYDTHNFILEKKKLKSNEKGNSGTISTLCNIKEERNSYSKNLKNSNYYVKKLHDKKFNEDEITKKHNKNNIYDIYDNFPINNYEFTNNEKTFKKNDVEIIRDNYDLDNNEIYTEDHLNINQDYNLPYYFSDILNKYENFIGFKDVNNHFEDFNKNRSIMKNSDKYSYVKSVDNNDVINKKDILLRIMNNLKFEKILNEKKKNCKLQINLKNNPIFSTNPFIDNNMEMLFNKCNISNRSKYNTFIHNNNNVDLYNSRLTKIKYKDSNNFFCKNIIKKKLIDNADKNDINMLLFHNLDNNYLKNKIKKKYDNYNYSDIFLNKLDHVFIRKK